MWLLTKSLVNFLDSPIYSLWACLWPMLLAGLVVFSTVVVMGGIVNGLAVCFRRILRPVHRALKCCRCSYLKPGLYLSCFSCFYGFMGDVVLMDTY